MNLPVTFTASSHHVEISVFASDLSRNYPVTIQQIVVIFWTEITLLVYTLAYLLFS